ncbi:MAG TPA: hypothetical protein P5186_24415 [Candidatus Paceibacterota bacterium]|nr:hypothetical protein [Candidatus Paceibacterota bacterium]
MPSSSPSPQPQPAHSTARFARINGVILYVILLTWAGAQNSHLLNADGIAYIRIAHYYAMAETGLMVSGYWGPLLSWLMIPGLLLGLSPLMAARIAMGFSALLFLWGGAVLLRNMPLPKAVRLSGLLIIGLSGLVWSVTEITPDLLIAGLVSGLVGWIMSPRWIEDRWAPLKTGLLGSAAYLCKAVGLPLAIGILTVLALIAWLRDPRSRQRVLRTYLLSGLVLMAGAIPWILVISTKYHRLTYSTSAPIAHAIMGPDNPDHLNTFGIQFHDPEPGRLTAWEDPSNMPYNYWRPWQSRSHARHQWRLIQSNVLIATQRLAGLDLVGLGVVGLVSVLVMAGIPSLRRWLGQQSGDESVPAIPWSACAAPVLVLTLIYLPVYAGEQRFYYPAFIPLLGLAFSWVNRLAQTDRLRSLGFILVVISFAGPGLIQLRGAVGGYTDPAVESAWRLAHLLEKAHIEGPLAGSGMVAGQKVGLYTAFLLERSWHGDERQPSPETLLKTRARIMILNRQHPSISAFALAPGFHDLDPVLFVNPEEASRFPIKALVYQEKKSSL